MFFLLIGLALLGLKVFEVDPVTHWSWWVVLIPFALTAAWWSLADKFGITERITMKKFEDRRERRRVQAISESLGIDPEEVRRRDKRRR